MYGRGSVVAFQTAAQTNLHAAYYSDVLKFEDDTGHKKAMQLTITRKSGGQYAISTRIAQDTRLGRIWPPITEEIMVVPSLPKAAKAVQEMLFSGMKQHQGLIVHGNAPFTLKLHDWQPVSMLVKDLKARTTQSHTPQAPQA